MQYGSLLLFSLIVVSLRPHSPISDRSQNRNRRTENRSFCQLTSFPPLIGYGTCITLCGFAFGLRLGWIIAAGGCVAGGLSAFVLGRTILSPLFASLLSRDKVFIGLSRAVKEKGLLLVVLIRLSAASFHRSRLVRR